MDIEETGCSIGIYKDCPNKELFERELHNLDIRIGLNFKLNAEALAKNDKILDERLLRMNEFRDALRDQAATFITRADYQARHEEMQRQVDELRLSRARLEGKASMTSVYVSYTFAVISLIVSIVSLMKHM